MPKKEYKKLIDQALEEFKSDPNRADEHLHEKTSAEDDGEMFFCISSVVRESPPDRSIRRIFDRSGLDPKNPFHWLYLMESLAEVHFTTGTPGAKKTRTHEYYERFMQYYEEACRKNPSGTEEDLCRIIMTDHPENFGRVKSVRTILKIASEAKKILSIDNSKKFK